MGGRRGWCGGPYNGHHTDCFEHVHGANFVFFDGKSGYFGDHTMEMYHIPGEGLLENTLNVIKLNCMSV